MNETFVSQCGSAWESTLPTSSSIRISQQNILKQAPGVKPYVKHRVNEALDAWEEMIDIGMLQRIDFYSNTNRSNNTPAITLSDLRQFIALQYARGLYGRHIPRDFLWSKQYGIQIFKETMPRSKFRHI